ncbi:hypothetical protein [Chryseobacterium sp. Leaf394]|uniref:hypothetical protein n=1 Tax=Chryseobacterium sp. Leaf394 TaxID=1736361 RepID=UPI0006F90535|nr:hypothetical protein [Chryseobacterium sp. Leaf394]KQS90245.1 hypothetical protein ASG21_14930 [Chryseobacterium sp. Leaf394]
MKKYILIVISFLFFGCVSKDNEVVEAEKTVLNFYTFLKQHNKEDAVKLFDQQEEDREKFYLIYDMVENENGSILDYRLIGWQKTTAIGTDSESEFLLTYDVIRSISNTKESFLLQKVNDSVKIKKSKIDFDLTHKK